MTKNRQYRPFRIGLDLWIARVGSIVAWVWGVFWILMGLTGIGLWVIPNEGDAAEKIIAFCFLGFGLLHVLAILSCRRTKNLVKDFRLYCSVFAKEPDKSIPEMAKAVMEPVEQVMKNLKEMCRRGYFNGSIDYQKKQMVFPDVPQADQDQEMQEMNVIHCPGCGAVNAVTKAGGVCRYCDAPLAFRPQQTKKSTAVNKKQR